MPDENLITVHERDTRKQKMMTKNAAEECHEKQSPNEDTWKRKIDVATSAENTPPVCG